MKYDLVTADQLREVWDSIKPGLERVREKGKCRWVVEEIFVALYHKRAALFIGSENDKRHGFLVTEIRRDDTTTELPYLNVWIAFAEPHSADIKSFVPDTVAFLDAHAKQLNLRRIAIKGGRSGWAKALAGYFEPVHVMYERTI